MKTHFFICLAAFVGCTTLFAQERKDKTPVTYEELYDEPSSVNKFFVGFQPLYGELFTANVNGGFGVEAVYYHKDKMDFKAQFRKTYSRKFFDFSRDQAMNNNDGDNRVQVYSYYELGATYHVKDFEQASKTKMFLFKNSYKGNKWSARVPLFAEVPSKVRKIYGVRLGGIAWASTTELNRALTKQGLTLDHLRSTTNSDLAIPSQEHDQSGRLQNVDLFTNISSKTVYLGGSLGWIRNVAVSFDKYEEGVDDLMLTVFADILVAPSVMIDNVVYTQKDNLGNRLSTDTYSVSPLKTAPVGFRLGIDGRFNRTFSWAYGGEIGYRPGIQGRQFFALFKISFPMYGTNLDYKVESFGK
jgi:hypothetical protein